MVISEKFRRKCTFLMEQAYETLFYRHDTWKEAGFQRRRFYESVFEAESSDPPPERDLSTGAEPDEVKHVLADIRADDRRWRRVGLHPGLHAASPAQRC